MVEGFDVTVTWPDGRTSDELVWTSDTYAPGMWRFPYDPVLPGLAHLLIDGPSWGAPGTGASLEVVSLRPLRSAVVRNDDGERARYAKVVPPEDVAELVTRHRVAARSGVPVPEVLEVDERWGVVWLSALPGVSHRPDLLAAAADEVVDVVLRLRSTPIDPADGDLRPAPDLLGQAEHHVAMLEDLDAELGAQAQASLRWAAGRRSVGRLSSTGVVHGDLHDGQILVDDGRVSGLIDLDTLGVGDVADDLGRLAGRLVSRGEQAAAQQVIAAAERAVGARLVNERLVLSLLVSSIDAWRMCDPTWRDRAAALVDEAERWQARN